MFDSIEQFCRAHQYTLLALSAFGTLAAVIVSLYSTWEARRATFTRLTTSISIFEVIHDLIPVNNRPLYVGVDIINVGQLPAKIPFSFFRWHIPFSRTSGMVSPLDWFGQDAWIPKRVYPAEINPRNSAKLTISSLDVFRTQLGEYFDRIKWFPRLRFRFIRAQVMSDDGAMFKVKITKDIRDEIARILREKSAN